MSLSFHIVYQVIQLEEWTKYQITVDDVLLHALLLHLFRYLIHHWLLYVFKHVLKL